MTKRLRTFILYTVAIFSLNCEDVFALGGKEEKDNLVFLQCFCSKIREGVGYDSSNDLECGTFTFNENKKSVKNWYYNDIKYKVTKLDDEWLTFNNSLLEKDNKTTMVETEISINRKNGKYSKRVLFSKGEEESFYYGKCNKIQEPDRLF